MSREGFLLSFCGIEVYGNEPLPNIWLQYGIYVAIAFATVSLIAISLYALSLLYLLLELLINSLSSFYQDSINFWTNFLKWVLSGTISFTEFVQDIANKSLEYLHWIWFVFGGLVGAAEQVSKRGIED